MTNVNKKNEGNSENELVADLGLLSKKEAANICMVSTSTIDRWARNGLLKPIKTGTVQQSRIYFKQQDVLDLFNSYYNEKSKAS